MSRSSPVSIVHLPTGVPGLDYVLGGGIAEYSFNLIAGGPGTGKTTLAQQMLFANSSPGRPGLYFTILGEPPLKMLRYQQQFSFFDSERVNRSIHFINLSREVLEHDLKAVLDTISDEVQQRNASLVVVDSFQTVAHAGAESPPTALEMEASLQQLAVYLANCQATTFLVGEYQPDREVTNPVFTVADGILLLRQAFESDPHARSLQVLKARGQQTLEGIHPMRIDSDGVQVFGRVTSPLASKRPADAERAALGIDELDAMLMGGIPVGDAALVNGGAGTGKSVLAAHFLAEGAHQGQRGLVVLFDESVETFVARAEAMGLRLARLVESHQVLGLDLRTEHIAIEEVVGKIVPVVQQTGARRIVVDSLSGLQLSLSEPAATPSVDAIARLIGPLTANGETLLLCGNVPDAIDWLGFVVDDVLWLRQVESRGRLARVLGILKMRSSRHSSEQRIYELTDTGFEVGDSALGFSELRGGRR